MFPGQYEDIETGLYYNYFRYYDPQTGRYLSSDRIGIEDSLNTYTYVDNNPINFYDPNGLGKTGAVIGGAIGSTIGAIGGGFLGGAGGAAGGTLVAPGLGTVGGGAAGVAEGVALGGSSGGLAGAIIGSTIEDTVNAIKQCFLPPDGKEVCTLKYDQGNACGYSCPIKGDVVIFKWDIGLDKGDSCPDPALL